MRKKIYEIVIKAVHSSNEFLDNKVPIEKGELCALYGDSGLLDSLSLVSLIVAVEQGIEDEFNISIILASEKAMSQKRSPFYSVETLVDYAALLVSQEVAHV